MAAGVPADSPTATDLADQHRHHISRVYDCTHEIHRRLAEMYVRDHRLTETIDGYGPGLATYLRDAILANGA